MCLNSELNSLQGAKMEVSSKQNITTQKATSKKGGLRTMPFIIGDCFLRSFLHMLRAILWFFFFFGSFLMIYIQIWTISSTSTKWLKAALACCFNMYFENKFYIFYKSCDNYCIRWFIIILSMLFVQQMRHLKRHQALGF